MSLILTLILVGVLLYLVSTIPMDPAMMTIIRVVVILAVIIWVIDEIGLLDVNLSFPRLRPRR